MQIGLQDDYVFLGESGFSREIAFERAAEIGVTKIRANVLWSRVLVGKQADQRKRPAKPRYDLEAYDYLVGQARERGMAVELTLTGPAPRWATGDKVKSSNKNPSAKEFARFARDIAKHYRGQDVPATSRHGAMNRAREAHIEATKGQVFELDTTTPPKPGESPAPPAPTFSRKSPSANTMLDDFLDDGARSADLSPEELKRLETARENQLKAGAILRALQSLLTEKGYL